MKKVSCLALITLLVLCLFPPVAFAADPLEDGESLDISTCSAGDTVTVAAGASVTISGTQAVQIVCGAGVELTLSSAFIDLTETDDACPITFTGSGNKLIFANTNILAAGNDMPGIRVEDTAELTIDGTGALNTYGGQNGAGIGGGENKDCGNITIEGGTIRTQSGGTVTASGNGAGIGGGNLGAGGTIKIFGGTVFAYGGQDGSAGGGDIGSGLGSGNGGTLNLDGAAYLYLKKGGTNATVTKGDVYIQDDSNAITDGYYVNGTLFTGTIYNLTTCTLDGSDLSSVLFMGSAAGYAPVIGSEGLTMNIVFFGCTGTSAILSSGTLNIELCGKSTFAGSFGPGLNLFNGATTNIRSSGGVTGSLTVSGISGCAGIQNPDGILNIYSGIIHATGGDNAAGIGTADGLAAGTTNIYGGDVTARGGNNGAGIGGGNNSNTGTIMISGGTVKATGGGNAAGIGGGNGGSGGTINISGTADVTATGGNYAAGIGGGAGASGALVSCGSITINGTAKVTATAGADGAGIGTGQYGGGGTIEISGSANVTATGKDGEDGAGIGWGGSSTGGSITISGGTVNATGTSFGAGLGGDANDGHITISGGNVTAMGSGTGAAIGGAQGYGAGTIKITGGNVDATSYRGAAIGCGAFGAADGTVEISGGTVTADSKYYGTGIGSGQRSTAAVDVTISGTADVTASAGANEGCFGGAGIGSGAAASSCDVTILGGTVTATGALGAAGIGGGINSDSGTITISGGTVTATGNLYSENGSDYTGAGIGGGAYMSVFGGGGGASGSIAISGGVVYASGATGADDIGYGSGYTGTSGSLGISGTAAVFMAHDNFLAPVTTATHTHTPYSTDTEETYGYAIPSAWTPTFGSFLRLYTLSYSAGSGTDTAPASATQLYNTTAAVAGGSGLSRTNYTFDGWNTAADGSGTNYAAGSTFTFTANTTLFAKWKAVPTLASSDADGKIYTGGRVTLTPNIAGGTWTFDSAYLSRDGNMFTALKAGTVRVTYTADGQTAYYDVTIVQSQLPPTGQDTTWVWVLAGAAMVLTAAGLLVRRRVSAARR